MIYNKFKAFLVVMCIAFFNTAHSGLKDKSIIGSLVDTCSSSSPFYLWDKYFLGSVNNSLMAFTGQGEELASEEYQLLGKEAQDALGIPENRQLPIRKIAPTSVVIKVMPIAFSLPNGIYFNEKNLSDKPFGAKRSAAFVEAIHKKYNHSGAESLIGLGNLIIMSVLIYKAIKLDNNKLIKSLAVLSSILGTSLVAKIYTNYSSHRADIEGHYATECYFCVQESAAVRQQLLVQTPFFNGSNFLNTLELEEIAQDLKNQNRVCTHHKNNQ